MNENNNNSQTFSQPNRSNVEKTKNVNTNYTASTEAMMEAESKEIINRSHKTHEENILNNIPKSCGKNHKKKKIDDAIKQADLFNDNTIKQFKFAKADEEEEANFRELCSAFEGFN